MTNFYWILAFYTEMIWCNFHNRTTWVIAVHSGFLNNWPTTFEGSDSSWKCWHDCNWCAVNGIAGLCIWLEGAAELFAVCSANFDQREVFDIPARNGSVLHDFCVCVCCEKERIVVFITRSVSWGWLISGPNTNPWSQLFQIFVWQAATQQQLYNPFSCS